VGGGDCFGVETVVDIEPRCRLRPCVTTGAAGVGLDVVDLERAVDLEENNKEAGREGVAKASSKVGVTSTIFLE